MTTSDFTESDLFKLEEALEYYVGMMDDVSSAEEREWQALLLKIVGKLYE